MLQEADWASGCFYCLLDGHLLAERVSSRGSGGSGGSGGAGAEAGGAGGKAGRETAIIPPGEGGGL